MYPLIKQLKEGLDPSPYRLWYNDWVIKNAHGNILDVGKSTLWDYGVPTFDINSDLKPTYVGNIEKTDFKDSEFDVVLCNGLYETVDNPQKMIDEVTRISKLAIFGFVGKDYKPHRKPWKFYEGKETFPLLYAPTDFGKEYHFIIWKR